MTSYTVYLPPQGSVDNPEESFRLVPDTKAKLALIFPPFWLAWHKLWLPLMAYFVVIVAIIMIAISSPSIAVSYLSILPGFYLLLEGYQLVRQNLENQGWQYAGVVEGQNKEEAEIRFLMENNHLFSNDAKPQANVDKQITQSNMSLFPE